MASQSFPALDVLTDKDSPVDPDLSGAADDFGMYVVRMLQPDAPEAPKGSGSLSSILSLDPGSVLRNGTHASHTADNDANGVVNLPPFGAQDHPAVSFDDANLGIAGLIEAAQDSGLIFLDANGFAKAGGGSGGGTSGGTTPAPYISGLPGHYNIEVDFKGTWTADLVNDFKKAADLLSTYITADIPNVLYKGKIIDDLQITAELTSIDGPGGILGQSGPTAVRTGSYLPALASMQFDIADANAFQAQGLFDDIVLHEMMHTLGFGAIWSYKGLLNGAGTANPLFTGSKAVAAYQTLFSAPGGAGVPVEQDGGSGTRDSHWDEQTFKSELMTGYIGDGSNMHDYLSYMSVASLGDLGYTLDPSMTASNFHGPAWIS